jgi:hypothetical protein
MLKKTLCIVAGLSFSVAALAQQPTLGHLGNVDGLVTVSDGDTIRTVTSNNPITNGMRILTGSNGKVMLQMNNGCTVEVRPNQSVTVLQGMTCDQLKVAVNDIPGPVLAGGGGGPLITVGGRTFTLVGGSLLALAAIVKVDNMSHH